MDTALRVPKARFSESGNLEIGSKRDGRVQSNAKEYLKAIQKSQEVPNKALKKQTKKFNTGRSKADKVTHRQGNPGSLKMNKGGKYDPRKAAMMKGLEAKIKKAKGTPAAASLVQKYRKLTGVNEKVLLQPSPQAQGPWSRK